MNAVARGASVLTTVLGALVLLYILFGPTVVRCYSPTIGSTGIGQPVMTLEPGHCDTLSLLASQPVWPMPLLALLFWALVPLIAVAGAWRRMPSLVLAALLLELTAVISFGAGEYYVLFVAVPLAGTWVLTSIQSKRVRLTT